VVSLKEEEEEEELSKIYKKETKAYISRLGTGLTISMSFVYCVHILCFYFIFN